MLSKNRILCIHCLKCLVFISIVGLSVCCSTFSLSAYRACIASGLERIPSANEMAIRFPITDHFVVHYNVGEGSVKQWQTESHFGGRFVLTMTIDVELNSTRSEIVSVRRDPSFYLREYTKISPRTDGGFSVDVGKQVRFGQIEWDRLKTSMDLGMFFEEWKHPQPLDNFDSLAKQISQNRLK